MQTIYRAVSDAAELIESAITGVDSIAAPMANASDADSSMSSLTVFFNIFQGLDRDTQQPVQPLR